jgi:quinol monooxygenase YgiN
MGRRVSHLATIQVLAAVEGGRSAALAALSIHVLEAHRHPAVVRLALHESTEQEGEFVLIGAVDAADPDAVFCRPHRTYREVQRLQLTQLPHGRGPKADLTLPAPPGQAETTLCFVALLPIKPGAIETAIDLIADEMAPTHAEPGVHRFILTETDDLDDTIPVIEAWRDADDWRAHHQTPWCRTVFEHLPPLLREEMTVYSLRPIDAGDPALGRL